MKYTIIFKKDEITEKEKKQLIKLTGGTCYALTKYIIIQGITYDITPLMIIRSLYPSCSIRCEGVKI